jgi:hypothetical protein
MVEALAGPPPIPFVTVQVTNRDWPLSDHGAYWENFEEAMSRMVHAITDSRLGWQPLTALGGSYAVQTPAAGATAAHPLAAPVEQAIMAAPERQRHVTTRRFASFLLIAVCVLFLITASPSIGHWLLGEQVTGPVLSWSGVDLSWPKVEWREALDARIPSSIAGIDFTDKRPWIVGAIALAFLAEVLLILARLGMHLWSWRRAEPTSEWIGSYGSN